MRILLLACAVVLGAEAKREWDRESNRALRSPCGYECGRFADWEATSDRTKCVRETLKACRELRAWTAGERWRALQNECGEYDCGRAREWKMAEDHKKCRDDIREKCDGNNGGNNRGDRVWNNAEKNRVRRDCESYDCGARRDWRVGNDLDQCRTAKRNQCNDNNNGGNNNRGDRVWNNAEKNRVRRDCDCGARRDWRVSNDFDQCRTAKRNQCDGNNGGNNGGSSGNNRGNRVWNDRARREAQRNPCQLKCGNRRDWRVNNDHSQCATFKQRNCNGGNTGGGSNGNNRGDRVWNARERQRAEGAWCRFDCGNRRDWRVGNDFEQCGTAKRRNCNTNGGSSGGTWGGGNGNRVWNDRARREARTSPCQLRCGSRRDWRVGNDFEQCTSFKLRYCNGGNTGGGSSRGNRRWSDSTRRRAMSDPCDFDCGSRRDWRVSNDFASCERETERACENSRNTGGGWGNGGTGGGWWGQGKGRPGRGRPGGFGRGGIGGSMKDESN